MFMLLLLLLLDYKSLWYEVLKVEVVEVEDLLVSLENNISSKHDRVMQFDKTDNCIEREMFKLGENILH